jgi:arylformamidase
VCDQQGGFAIIPAIRNGWYLDARIEKDLLAAGIISFENLANLNELPESFVFYGMPLHIRGGDGSPVRAFAVIEAST